MAAVTVNNSQFNVNGSLRDQYYNISGGSGDYLDVGINSVVQVNVQPKTNGVTNVSIAAAPVPGQSRITFTSGGAFVGLNVQVVGN